MGTGRQKEIDRHLTEQELDDRLAAEDDPEIVQRLCFIKNLYEGDTIEQAARRVGKSQPTGSRWADRWNEGGLDRLAPDYGEGRPPKLDEHERDQLVAMLEAGQPWTTQEIRHLIEEEFDVTYHPAYIYELLRSLDMQYAKPRPNRPERPDDADQILADRIDETLTDADEADDTMPDGGYVVGFSTRRGPNRRTTASESGRSMSPN